MATEGPASGPEVLRGLRLPGRVSVEPVPVAVSTATPRQLVVRRGDSLWSLAARTLGPGATPSEIAAAWPRLYAANRDVVGPDPARIEPGQHLTVPSGELSEGLER
jgi:nucleoid-associated protein YgaU